METELNGLIVTIHGAHMDCATPSFESVTVGKTLTLTASELYELGPVGVEIDTLARVAVASDALERRATLQSLKEWLAVA